MPRQLESGKPDDPMEKFMRVQRTNYNVPRTSRKAFTLIELLVVIAVIALLTSVLLPALRKAKQSAQSMVCRTRLKQMGVAIHLYAQDNDDEIVTQDWHTPRIRLNCRSWPGRTGRTKTALKKKPRFAFIAVCVSDTVPKSSGRTRLDLSTEEQGKKSVSFRK